MNQNYFRFYDKTYKQSDEKPIGSTTSGIFSEIFLQEMEVKHFHHLKSNHNISIITRYVDDMLIIYNHNKHTEEQIAQDLETIHKNIEFTYETETYNSINYLDLTLKNNFRTNSIDIKIYRKPSSNTIVIHRKSRHPQQQNLSIFNSLIHRLTNLPITTNSYNKELKYIRTLSEDNGFNNRTVNKLLHKYRNKQNTISALETQKYNNTNNN
jgi:hypothetical protein